MAYPFNPKNLDPDLVAAIQNHQPYQTDKILESIMERKGLRDTESLLTLAYFTWVNAALTEFDEDVLQFGREALEILNPLLEREPRHKGANTLKKTIEGQIKKAEKVQKKLEKYNKIPEEKLDLDDAEELAYFLADNKKDPESKRKEYRLWYRLYQEIPDTKTVTDGNRSTEYYGYAYFYLGYAAVALWEAGEREQARPLFWKLIEWPVERDVKLYDHISITVPRLLLEAIEKDDLSEFRRLIRLMENHDRLLHKKMTIYTKHADEILAYAVRKNDGESLPYIVNGLMDGRSERSMDTGTKENMARAKAIAKE